MICTAAKYYKGNQVQKHKVGGACDIHGQKINSYWVLLENLRETVCFEDPGIGGILLQWIFKTTGWEACIHMIQDSE